MRCTNVILMVSALALAVPAYAADSFSVTFEKPGVQNSTTVTNLVGVENFDARTAGPSTFTKVFSPEFSVTYTGVSTLAAGNNGGAGGTGRYARVGPASSTTIDIANTSGKGINYFGMWISAFDSGNFVDFKRAGSTVYSFGPADVLAALGACPGGSYCGNPNSQFLNAVPAEPFAFVNFRNNDSFFDQVVLRQASQVNPNAGYQTDNHTFANISVSAVPEPATWAMLIGGFGLAGASLRRNRKALAA